MSFQLKSNYPSQKTTKLELKQVKHLIQEIEKLNFSLVNPDSSHQWFTTVLVLNFATLMFFGIKNINKVLNFEFKNWIEVFHQFKDPLELFIKLTKILPLFDTQDRTYNHYIDHQSEITSELKKLEWGRVAEKISRASLLQNNHILPTESTAEIIDFGLFDKIGNFLREFNYKSNKHTGIIYTPYSLAEQITKKTISQWYKKNVYSDVKTIKKVKIRLLDPTVGTGIFLIAAGNILYNIIKTEDPDYSSLSLKRRIIEHYLYGFDIDPIGILITKIKLRLWILDDLMTEIDLYEVLTDNVIQRDSLSNYHDIPNHKTSNFEMKTHNNTSTIYKLPWKSSLHERILDINHYHNEVFKELRGYYFILEGSRPEWNEKKNLLAENIRKNVHFSISDYFNPSNETYAIFPNGEQQINEKIISNLIPWNFSKDIQKNEKNLPSKFEIIVGNPPFVALTDLSMITRLKIKGIFPDIYNGNSDLSFFFVKRMMQILRPSGMLGFLLPKSLLSSVHAEKIREFILRMSTILEIHDFNKFLLFPHTNIKTCCILLENKEFNSNSELDVYKYLKLTSKDEVVTKLNQNKLKSSKWTLISREENEIIEKIESISNYRLQEISSISKGIETGCDKIFAPKTPYFFSEKLQLNSSHFKPWLKGKEIKPFLIRRKGREVLFAPKYRRELIKNSKEAYQYLKDNQKVLLNRSRVSRYFLWREGDERSTMEWQNVKIVTPYKAKTNTFAIDDEGCLSSKDVVWIVPHEPFKESDTLLFLVSLLNSKILTFYARCMFKDLGGMYDYYPLQIKEFPLFIPDRASQEYIDIVNLTNQIQDTSDIEKQVSLEKLNEIFYQLYSLTKQQILEIESFLMC